MNESGDTEKQDDKLPPCVAQCAPEFENEIEILMGLPCKFLRAIGVCHSDGDLCKKILKPSSYLRIKGKSFRPAERRKSE